MMKRTCMPPNPILHLTQVSSAMYRLSLVPGQISPKDMGKIAKFARLIEEIQEKTERNIALEVEK